MVPLGDESSVTTNSSNVNSNNEHSFQGKLVEFDGQAIKSQQGVSLEQCVTGSICFRTLKSSLLEFRYGAENKTPVWFKSVMIPDKNQVGVLDIEHAFLVHKVTKLGLKDGILESVNINTPSSALAAARLPLDVINALLDVPVGFFNNISAGFQSQAAATDAQANLLKVQGELDRSIREALAGGIPTGGSNNANAAITDPSNIGAPTSTLATFSSGLSCIKLTAIGKK